MVSADFASLSDERIRALFREDPQFGVKWGMIQAQVQLLLADLEKRGWDKRDRTFALQTLLRSIVVQVETREAGR